MVVVSLPYSKFYLDRTGGIDITKSPLVEISSEEPKVSCGYNKEEDFQRMIENGYFLIGYSSFNAGSINKDGAIFQAKKIHASIVILYSQYTNTVSGAIPLTLPNKKRSSTKFSGNVYSSSGYANYSGNTYTTTYGSKTTYIPYNVRRYEYLATYWVKSKPPIFGTILVDITNKIGREIGSNKGMLIETVINGSPAFRGGIFKGDVLRKIGGIDIYNNETFQESLKKYKGQTINVVVFQNGKEVEKEIKLNTNNWWGITMY